LQRHTVKGRSTTAHQRLIIKERSSLTYSPLDLRLPEECFPSDSGEEDAEDGGELAALDPLPPSSTILAALLSTSRGDSGGSTTFMMEDVVDDTGEGAGCEAADVMVA